MSRIDGLRAALPRAIKLSFLGPFHFVLESESTFPGDDDVSAAIDALGRVS